MVAVAILAWSAGTAHANCAGGTVDTAEITPCAMPPGIDFTVTATGSVTTNGAHAIHNNQQDVGRVTNAGTLNVDGMVMGVLPTAGIFIGNGTATGGIVNTGTIVGTSFTVGISVGDSFQPAGVVLNGITNSGSISGDSGIVVNGSVSGGILNTSGGVLDTQGVGILLNGGPVSGDITNHGSVRGGIWGIDIAGSEVAGSIVNTGTIATTSASGLGIAFEPGSKAVGIVNEATGVIDATHEGIGISFYFGTLTDSIRNAGTIRATYAAMYLDSSSFMGIHNSGLIEGMLGSGIYLYSSDLQGGIDNTGTIRGAYGVVLDGGTTVDKIVNQGVIAGTDGSAIGLDSGASLQLLENAGTLEGTTYAIEATNGTLSRLRLVGTAARVVGDVASPATDVVLASNARFANTNAFDVKSFTVEPGANLDMGYGLRATGSGLGQDGIRVASGFFNRGTVSIAAGLAPLVTGSYTQDAGATLRVGVTSVNEHGRLRVSDSASFANGTQVAVDLVPGAAVAPGATVEGVVQTGTSLAAVPASLKVTDNSLLYNFVASTARNAKDLDLVVVADPTAIVQSAGGGPASGAAGALQQVFSSGSWGALAPVFAKLGSMSSDQIGNAVRQTLPALSGAGTQAGLQALHTMNKVIQSRVEGNQGLSAGDPMADRNLWVRAFGTRGDQNDVHGVEGFNSRTTGFVLGGDAPYSEGLRVGAALTYARSTVNGNSTIAPSRAEVDTYEAVGYGSYKLTGDTEVNYQVDIGRNAAKTQRAIGFMGTQANASFDSLTLHSALGIGRMVALEPGSRITPSLRLDYARMRTDGHSETGAGPLNLQMDRQTFDEFILSADVKYMRDFDHGWRLAANAGLGYDFRNQALRAVSTFAGGGPAFVTAGVENSPWVYRAGLGLTHAGQTGPELSVRYDAEGRRSGYLNQTLSLRARWLF